MAKQLTLCIVHQNEKVLLGMKKRGFGQGRWNGFGGKVHEGETIEDAALREVEEECGIIVEKIHKRGILLLVGETEDDLEIHVFEITAYRGVPEETEEMKPQWFHENSIPFEDMWPDDTFWLPLFLQKKYFIGKFVFDHDAIIEYQLDEVERKSIL